MKLKNLLILWVGLVLFGWMSIDAIAGPTKKARKRRCLMSAFESVAESPPEPSHDPSPKSLKVPLVYSEKYQFDLFGIEKYHPFASKKYSEVMEYLLGSGIVLPESWYSPVPLSDEQLLTVHTSEYIRRLMTPEGIFGGFEYFRPRKPADREIYHIHKSEITNRIFQTEVLGAAGTVLASELALREAEKWAINLSGGYHHAHSGYGSGFCLIADGPIAIKKILEENPTYQVLIVDLDAHHGDGNAEFFAKEVRVHIFDIYNKDNFPFPQIVKEGRKFPVEFEYPIPAGTEDGAYIALLSDKFKEAIEKVRPNVIFYNAGTDIFEKDPLGGLRISAEGIIIRDEMVFRGARSAGIPIFMALSGGYSNEVFRVIGRSIENLAVKGIIQFHR